MDLNNNRKSAVGVDQGFTPTSSLYVASRFSTAIIAALPDTALGGTANNVIYVIL